MCVCIYKWMRSIVPATRWCRYKNEEPPFKRSLSLQQATSNDERALRAGFSVRRKVLGERGGGRGNYGHKLYVVILGQKGPWTRRTLKRIFKTESTEFFNSALSFAEELYNFKVVKQKWLWYDGKRVFARMCDAHKESWSHFFFTLIFFFFYIKNSR